MFKKAGFTLLLAWLYCAAQGQVSIIPQPALWRMKKTGGCLINAESRLLINDPSLQPSADFLNEYLHHYYGFRLRISRSGEPGNVALLLNKKIPAPIGSYALSSASKNVVIRSSNAEGIFYGVQSLIQMLPVSDTSGDNEINAKIKWLRI